jgi:uncharacterized protein YecT (DUF1311 family)
MYQIFMTRLYTFLLLACIAGCAQAPKHKAAGAPDSELLKLTAALDSAQTQTGMNLASQKISDFWDGRLASVEKRLLLKLDGEDRRRFSDSMKHWRSYRMHEVQFRAGFYEGGSIQPLIANTAHSQITEHRAGEMESQLRDVVGGDE